MERHVLAAVCLALVAATAGCGGVFGGETTPSPTPEPSDPELVPGVPDVDQNGTEMRVDTDRLRAVNTRLRANTSYTLQRTVAVNDSDGNGTLAFDRTLLVTSAATLEYLDVEQSGQFSAVLQNGTRWSGGDGTWTRTALSNGRTTVLERLGGEIEPYGYGTDLVNRSLSVDTYQVESAGDDAVLLRRDVEIEPGPMIPISTGPPTAERVGLGVDDSGVVRSLAVRYTAIYGTETVTVTIRHDLRNVGSTTVQRPAWVPTDA
jgi:hypothetical protein